MNELAIVNFMPHGMCYPQKPGLVGLHLISNGIIALAYFSIPITLIYILRRRGDIPFNGIFLLFAAFILACGTGHAFDIWTLWHPNYWISGGIKLLTALVSCATAIALVVKIPQILTLPSPSQIEEINQQLREKINKLEQAETKLDQENSFLQALLDNLSDGIVACDENGVLTLFNKATREFHGLPQQAIPVDEWATYYDLYFPDGKTTMSREDIPLFRALQGESVRDVEMMIIPKQGKSRILLANGDPIIDRHGKKIGAIVAMRDITERREAETKLEKERIFNKTLLNHLSDGIVACDENGILALFNPASQEFFGVPQEPLPPQKWAKHYSLYDAEGENYLKQEDIPLFRAFSGESFVNAELMAIPKNGKPRTLLANGSPIFDTKGVKLGAVVAVRDITERKQAEQALAKLNEELEDRVKQRTVQFEQLNAILLATTATLEQRNQELDQFAYVTSHDLKAPLRAIANLSEWIEEDLEDKLDQDTRDNMNLLRGRVHRLENLINGLLDYSRVGRLNSTPQSVDVAEMLAEIIDLLDVPDSCQIQIQENMPTLVTEAIPLQQIFRNLISNAVKHSDCENSKIDISVQEFADYYEFAVADNGKGIDPKDHERIFTIFQTLEARDVKESTGIGLAIVKKAVENQGGEIKIESDLGTGSTFKFTWQKSQALS